MRGSLHRVRHTRMMLRLQGVWKLEGGRRAPTATGKQADSMRCHPEQTWGQVDGVSCRYRRQRGGKDLKEGDTSSQHLCGW